MIIEQGSPVKVVAYAPGAAATQISKNGDAFVAGPVPSGLGGDYFVVDVPATYTDVLGPLLVSFTGAPAGTYVVVQVRSIVTEIRAQVVYYVLNAFGNKTVKMLEGISKDVLGVVGKLVPTLASLKRPG